MPSCVLRTMPDPISLSLALFIKVLNVMLMVAHAEQVRKDAPEAALETHHGTIAFP